jgi:nucleotide-binding universal stress UspA family protein
MLKLKRILVPVDFSDASRAALDYATDLARAVDGSLDLLHVWEAPVYVTQATPLESGLTQTSLMEAVQTQANDGLHAFVLSAKQPGAPIRSLEIEMGAPASTICEYARSGRHDLIVMGTHGRTGIARVVIGSVAEHVVRLAPCPVLTVRHVQAAA